MTKPKKRFLDEGNHSPPWRRSKATSDGVAARAPSPWPERFSWRLVVLRVEAVFDMKKPTQPHSGSTHQTVIEVSTRSSCQSIRIDFTDQRLTAYGGMAFWSAFLHK